MQIEKENLRFALDLNTTIPEMDKEKVQTLMKEAYKNCPLTKATDGKVEVNLSLD